VTLRSSAAAGTAFLAAVLAVVVAGSQHLDLAESRARPRQVPVTTATLSCPAPPAARGSTTRLFAATPGTTHGSSEPPSLRLTAGVTTSTELAATSVSRVPLSVTLPPATDSSGAGPSPGSEPSGALVSASGDLAAGVAAAELSTFGSGTSSGTAATWCSAPRSEWWFNGVDTSVGTTTSLHLSNPGAGTAVVVLEVFGPHGPVPAPGAQDLAIAPRSADSLDLARFAPGRPALTLHISASRGAVAAAVSTTRLDGLTPTGAEWVPASTEPGPTVVVDAGVAGADRQRLVITNPGPRQQLVAARILDRSGSFVSTALTDVQVPPGAVVVKDITSITRHRASAVELSSAAAVTGAIVSETSGADRDFAVSGVSEPIAGPAIVPTMDGSALTLSFTATSNAPRTVRIASIGRAGMLVHTARLVVLGGSTTSWTMPAGSAASYVVIGSVDGSDLQAVASFVAKAGASQLPVRPGRFTVVEPVVAPVYP